MEEPRQARPMGGHFEKMDGPRKRSSYCVKLKVLVSSNHIHLRTHFSKQQENELLQAMLFNLYILYR